MPKVKDDIAASDSVLVQVPLAEVPSATWSLHINTHLSPEQSRALRRVTAALDRQLARLANGQRVVNASGAIKYLLEQITPSEGK